MKALVTGGTSGFGLELVQSLGPESVGVSRASGHNLWKSTQRKEIVGLSLEFDAFVNFAHADFMQTRLLYELADAWKDAGKGGHIFNIGSHATYDPPHILAKWIVSKYSLDVANKQFCRMIEDKRLPFRMTLIRLGLLNTAMNRESGKTSAAHTAAEVAGLIRHVYNSPKETLVHELSVHSTLALRS